MTVEEFIEELKDCPLEFKVVFHDREEGYLEVEGTDVDKKYKQVRLTT